MWKFAHAYIISDIKEKLEDERNNTNNISFMMLQKFNNLLDNNSTVCWRRELQCKMLQSPLLLDILIKFGLC